MGPSMGRSVGRLALGWFIDAGAMRVKARLARYGVRHVSVERSLTLLVTPRKRVQVWLRLHTR